MGEIMQTDMNKREREKFGRGMKLASTVMLAAGMAVEAERDELAARAISTFNLFLMSEWEELNRIFMEAAQSADSLADVKLTIPDSLPPDFTA
jgi:hypothetical protein